MRSAERTAPRRSCKCASSWMSASAPRTTATSRSRVRLFVRVHVIREKQPSSKTSALQPLAFSMDIPTQIVRVHINLDDAAPRVRPFASTTRARFTFEILLLAWPPRSSSASFPAARTPA